MSVNTLVDVFSTLFFIVYTFKKISYNKFEHIKLKQEAITIATLPERIKSLRLSKNLTQEQFGELFGIVKSTVSLYENGKSTPNDEIKKQICSYFHVSISYLMGYTDMEKDGFFFFFFNFDEWRMCYSRILEKLEDLSISEAKFEEDTGIHLDDETEVNVSGLIKTAKYLNVTTDYLLGLADAEYVSPEDISLLQSLTERERDVLAAFRKLGADDKDIIVGEIKKCLKEQRHSSVAADDPVKKTGISNTGN